MTSPREDPAGPSVPNRYGYFVLQASALWTGTVAELRGVMEDLTTGEKREFGSAADVARLMSAWAASGFDNVASGQVPAPEQGDR